jgi:prepilin signal peptidase PulO-like enzyme (type II secretory pathway)
VRIASDLVFVSMLAVVSATDLRCRLIPNRVLAIVLMIDLPLLAVVDPGSLPGRAAAMAVAGGPFIAVSLLRPNAFGMGDVKLIATMGFCLGAAVLGAVLAALCAGSLFGVGLIARDGRGAAKATIPFAPFLALGGLLALLGWLPALQ